MSVWKTIIENEISRLKTLNYPKLNCVQQEIADLLQRRNLEIIEVEMILEGMKAHKMLNMQICLDIHRQKWGEIYKAEGL